ncbi:hypothetical protein HN011_007572 [Eciton burchellii]|nr:hypothetical protein HN011_007572 [Eciton burchellii]
MPGNNVKRIFRQRSNSKTMIDKMFETPINQKITQKANRRSRRFLVNRIDSLLQNKKILDNYIARVRRSSRKKEKHAKDSDSDVVLQNNYKNDDDADEENALLDMERLRGFPIWQVPESTVTAINLDSLTNPMTRQIEMINPPLFKKPSSQLQNLDSDHFLKKANLPIYPNSQEKFTVSDKNLMFSKISNPKFEIDSDVNNHAFKNLSNTALFPTYLGLFVDINSPNFSQFQRSQWQYNYDQKNHPVSNIKKELSNNYLMSSKRKFMLIPISKDLYILKNVQDNNTNIDKINPKQYKLSVRNKDNTSAIVSFKAHLHHDMKNVGRAYLQKSLYNRYSDNANYIYSYSNPHISEENRNPTASLYPNFLYSTITSPALNLIDRSISEISIEQITPHILDYESYISMNSTVESDSKIESYDSIFLSTSFSFEILNDVSLYSEENVYYPPNTLPTTYKLDNINSFKLNSSNYEEFSINRELDVEMTTIDFRNTLGIFDNNLGTLVTLENVKIYSTNVNKEVFDLIQSTEDESKLLIREKEDKYKTDFVDNILMQYRSTLETYTKEDNTSSLNSINFINNAKNVLNNHDNSVQDNPASRVPILNEYSHKKSSHNLNYDNRFMDKVLFNDNIKVNSFFKTENYAIKQSNTENPYTLLMAIKPLSTELMKLLNAVKLFNQSINNMQKKLYDKKNIRSAKVDRKKKERKINIANHINKIDYYNPNVFIESLHKKFSNKRRKLIPENRNTVIQISNDLKSKRVTKSYVRFLNKITTPLYTYASFDNKLKIQNEHKNFFKNIKLHKKKSFKLGEIEKHRSFLSRFNRNLKSLTKNYRPQVKPIRQFIKSRFKESSSTTPIIILSHLIGYNISNKNAILNKGTHKSQRNNKLIFPSHGWNIPATVFNVIIDKNNESYSLSNNKRKQVQRNVKRAMLTEINGEKEITARQEIYQLLNVTEAPEEYSVVWTTTSLPKFIQDLITTTEEPLEYNEIEYVTDPDIDDEYNEGIYEDYEYNNITCSNNNKNHNSYNTYNNNNYEANNYKNNDDYQTINNNNNRQTDNHQNHNCNQTTNDNNYCNANNIDDHNSY